MASECETAARDPSDVQRFYEGANVFITGGTGFLGKVLLEKLLRTCPSLGTIYLLVRPKKGKHVHSRCEELFENPVFERLKREQPKFQHKVLAVAGDCSLPELGLSPADRALLQQRVHVVFHGAATVRFDEKLRLATSINVKGCREMLALCRQMPGLRALVHISTAYANCPWRHIEERFYPAPGLHYDKLIALTESADDKQLEHMTANGVLERWPNTYSFTKAVAEELVRSESAGLPTGVFRPSIVISTYREPMRGWVDNLYGATGVCAGAGVGVLRTLYCDSECISNIIPVDMTVNALICSAWDVAKRHQERRRPQDESEPGTDIAVYNYVSTDDNSLSWGRFMSLCGTSGVHFPSVRAVWYYSLTLNKYWLMHWLYVLLLHLVPGALVDGALLCTGRKPRMLRVYRHIIRFNTAISYFCRNTWSFGYGNVTALWERLSPQDKQLFFFDMRQMDWHEYFEEHMLGVRLYLLKDSIQTLPQARVKWRLFYWMHQATRVAGAFVLLRLAWALLSSLLLLLLPW